MNRRNFLKKMVGSAALMAIVGAQPAMAADPLGYKWVGQEYTNYEWNFEFTRAGRGNLFNAKWTNRRTGASFTGYVTISVSGSSVTISRTAAGGGGFATVYSGTYRKRDLTNGRRAGASGTYAGGAFPWRATVYPIDIHNGQYPRGW